MNLLDYKENNIVRKWLNDEIITDNEKNILIQLDNNHFKTCKAKTLLVKGEMTMIIGPKGSGKSKVASFLIHQLLAPKCFKGIAVNNNKDIIVILFDSEMPLTRLANWHIENIFHDYNKDFIEEIENRYYIYSIKQHSINDRLKVIKDIINSIEKDNPNSNLVVLIDVATCLVQNINDQDCNRVVNDLNAISTNVSFIIISHNREKTDKKDDYGTGAIGTTFERLTSIKLLVELVHIEQKEKYKINFINSKFDMVDTKSDYFFLHTEAIDENKMVLSGISDSNGPEIKTDRPGNSHVTNDEVLSAIKSRIESLPYRDNETLRKNIIDYLDKNDIIDLKRTSISNYIKKFLEEGHLFIDNDSYITLENKKSPSTE